MSAKLWKGNLHFEKYTNFSFSLVKCIKGNNFYLYHCLFSASATRCLLPITFPSILSSLGSGCEVECASLDGLSPGVANYQPVTSKPFLIVCFFANGSSPQNEIGFIFVFPEHKVIKYSSDNSNRDNPCIPHCFPKYVGTPGRMNYFK